MTTIVLVILGAIAYGLIGLDEKNRKATAREDGWECYN